MLARCNLAKKKEKHSLAPLDSAAEEADFHPRTWPSVRGHAWDFQRALLFRHGARFAKAAYVDTDFLAVGRDPDGIFDLVAPGAFGFWAGSHRRCFHDRG